MSTPDTPATLVTPDQLTSGALASLFQSYDPATLADLLLQATRACETECNRRLVPFTGLVETHRAEGVDPDEYSGSVDIPMDVQGTLGRSYAASLGGGGGLVRHCWLSEYAPQYPEFWSYSQVSITIVRSYGGSQVFTASSIEGPEVDSGHVWFRLGTWLPVGSWIRAVYSGGYTTIPADLVRGGMWMAGSIAVAELDPARNVQGHSSGELEAKAVAWLAPYVRG